MKTNAALCLLLLLTCNPASGVWTEKQSEVWNVIESTWAEEAKESGKWPTQFATSDYQSWGQDEALPQTLKTLDATLRYWNKQSKLNYYRLKPASITVNGDTAVVNYYATEYRETADGVKSRSVMAITETLVYRDDRWQFLASSSWMPKVN